MVNVEKGKRTCEDCVHADVCVVADKLESELHEDGALDAVASAFALTFDDPNDWSTKEMRFHEAIDEHLKLAIGGFCPKYLAARPVRESGEDSSHVL